MSCCAISSSSYSSLELKVFLLVCRTKISAFPSEISSKWHTMSIKNSLKFGDWNSISEAFMLLYLSIFSSRKLPWMPIFILYLHRNLFQRIIIYQQFSSACGIPKAVFLHFTESIEAKLLKSSPHCLMFKWSCSFLCYLKER